MVQVEHGRVFDLKMIQRDQTLNGPQFSAWHAATLNVFFEDNYWLGTGWSGLTNEEANRSMQCVLLWSKLASTSFTVEKVDYPLKFEKGVKKPSQMVIKGQSYPLHVC